MRQRHRSRGRDSNKDRGKDRGIYRDRDRDMDIDKGATTVPKRTFEKLKPQQLLAKVCARLAYCFFLLNLQDEERYVLDLKKKECM